jgi:hypothetical protein
MLGPLNGSVPLPHAANERVYGMLLAAQKPGETQYSTLLFVRYSTRVPAPNLRVAAISASSREPREGQRATLTATIENAGDAAAAASTTLFTLDGTRPVGSVATPAIAPGGSAQVTVSWDTRGVHGEHVVSVAADALAVIEEAREDDNTAALAVTVRGNRVENGSFDGSGGWSATSTGGGTAAPADGGASLTGTGGNVLVSGTPSWASAPVAVAGGETLWLAASVRAIGLASPATVRLEFRDAAGRPGGVLTALASPLSTSGFLPLVQQIVVPPGAASARVILSAFAGETSATGLVVFDDVGLYDG